MAKYSFNDFSKHKKISSIEFKELNEVCYLKTGKRITKSIMKDDFKYPVIGGGTEPTGSYYSYNFENAITISRAGSAGFVGFQKNKFWATDVCFVAYGKDFVDTKFIYYFLKSNEYDFKKHLYGGSMPKLDKNYLWKYIIPIPPLNVQKDIVKVLDILTDLQKELELQLKSELNARKKQYEYYREKLLSVQNLKDLINKNRRGGGYRLLFKIQKFRWLLWIWTGKPYYEKSSDSRKYTCGSLWENTPILS